MAKPIHHIPVVHDEHDSDASAKRIVRVSPLGRSIAYEDTSFLVGDSPIICDVNADLGRNGKDGYIVNDGDGNFTVEISDNGTTYGGVHTIKKDETITFEGMTINKIRITRVADSAYRVFII